jgi:hypothetical protein
LGGDIWIRGMLSSVVCHDGRKKTIGMSNSRYRAGLTTYEEKKGSNSESASESKVVGCLPGVVGNREHKCQSG